MADTAASAVDDLLGEMARLTIEHVGRPEGPHDRSMSALTRHDLVVLCDAVIAFRARCLAAEQRAEAAEQERDRMRKQLHRAMLALPPSPMCRDCADHDGTCQSDGVTPCDPYDAIPVEIARLRAGQPGPSEAEQIAAWLETFLVSDDGSSARIAAEIRAGAWRKGQS